MTVSCGSTLCMNNSLEPGKVAGKIVACLRGVNGRVEKGGVVKEAGAAGMILVNNKASGEELLADPHLLPATMLTYADGLKLMTYINTTGSVYPENLLEWSYKIDRSSISNRTNFVDILTVQVTKGKDYSCVHQSWDKTRARNGILFVTGSQHAYS